jgi:hypothetical protein
MKYQQENKVSWITEVNLQIYKKIINKKFFLKWTECKIVPYDQVTR